MMNNIRESIINPADVKAIFKDASALRDKPQGLLGRLKGLKKDKVTFDDLYQAWMKEGRPNDTRDIKRILNKDFGYDEKEIGKVFSEVFGQYRDSEEYKEPTASPTVQKIADYAKKNGIADSIKAFMAQEFSDELGLKESKIMYEDIGKIFLAIVQEERMAKSKLIHQAEQTHLGRSRK